MEKSSSEIMREIFYLFEQYVAARDHEEEVQTERLNYLDVELNKQREKNRQIAGILTRD